MMEKVRRRGLVKLGLALGAAFVVCPQGGAANPVVRTSGAWPIQPGEMGPIASSNPRQQPFACVTQDTPLGAPTVDNHEGIGFPVKAASGTVVGYSANCGAPMKVRYFYRASGDAVDAHLKPYDLANPPKNVAHVKVSGRSVPFIVRYEMGTINRFIYSIASLAPHPRAKGTPRNDESAWNRNLVFYFFGGVGIGHTQSSMPYPLEYFKGPGLQKGGMELLEQGYDVIKSTGTATATTYNLVLDGQTARMMKRQFVAEFGKPKYTFGLGASGGSIQQFIYAQNDPGLLDALVPTHVYPDMITQVNPVGDCELLEYYFDVGDAKTDGTGRVNPMWRSWANRQLIEGFHGINGFKSKKVIDSSAQPGSDACIEAWRGAVPMYFNPLYGAKSDPSYSVIPSAVLQLTPLSFFDDLRAIFGTIPGTDLARSTYDNVGVQYGLQALKDGRITKQQFLNLNAHVGGWVPRQDDVRPGYPYEGSKKPENVDPWSARNGTAIHYLTPDGIAPRAAGSIDAMRAAYRAGLVFGGNITVPVIIIEPYLEAELNMHASREPFAVRQRIIDARGNADNLAIWMTGNAKVPVLAKLELRALAYETKWLSSGRRPKDVANECFRADGSVIATGPDVFRGEVSGNGSSVIVDRKGGGPCTKAYPVYSDPRIISGENVSDGIFKCALEPVDVAIKAGGYGGIHFTSTERARLRDIFPAGVCDYSQPGQGRPPGWHGYPGRLQ